MQPLDVQVHGVLKGHGRQGETVVAEAIQERVEVHLLGEALRRLRFLREAPPMSGHVLPVVPRLPTAVGGVGDGAEGLQPAFGIDQEAGVKAAERMIAAGGHKALRRDLRLIADVGHQLVQSIAIGFRGNAGIAPEIGDGLKMDTPHGGGELAGQGDDLAQIVVIHALDHRRYQRDADGKLRADADGLPLGIQQIPAAQGAVDLIPRPIELEKHDIKPCLGEPAGVGGILGQADPVGVHLGIAASGLPGVSDQLRQIVAERRFPAGKLQQGLPALPHDVPDGRLAVFKRRVVVSTAAVGEAIAAAEIAALRDLQQRAASAALMLGADPAVGRAGETSLFTQRRRLQQPLCKVHAALPDGYLEEAVLRTALFQENLSALPAGEKRGDVFETHGADGAGLPYHLGCHCQPIARPSCLKTIHSSW